MKRTVLLIVAAFLMLNFSCARKEDDKRTKITYQTMETLPEQRRALEELVAEFERLHPEIRVEVLTSTTSFQKLSIQIAGGNAPDVFYYVSDRLPALAHKGIVMDLSSCIGQNDLGQYFEKTVESCKVDGKIYCMPFHFSTDVLFYNKDLFNKEGVECPSDKWTWEDFLAAAQKLTKKENGRVVQYGALQPRPLLLIKSFGGECFDKEMTRCVLNSPETKKALKFIIDMDKKYGVAPSAAAIKDMERMDGVDMFSTGRVAMLLGRTFMLSEFRKLKSFNWDIAPVPRGERAYSRLAVGGNCISSTTKHPKEAMEFVKYYSEKEASNIIARSGNCVPAMKDTAYSELFLYPPPQNIKFFVDSIEYSETDNPGLDIWEEFYQRIVQDNIDKILCGVVSMEDGMRKMEKEGNEMLKK